MRNAVSLEAIPAGVGTPIIMAMRWPKPPVISSGRLISKATATAAASRSSPPSPALIASVPAASPASTAADTKDVDCSRTVSAMMSPASANRRRSMTDRPR